MSDDAAEFVAGFSKACSEVIQSARRLRSRMVRGDLEAAGEFGDCAGRAFALAGATADEVQHYSARILEMVLAEMHT